MQLGSAFVRRTITREPNHLWVALTPPLPDGRVVIASFSSEEHHHDKTCRLSVGDHPFITHDTVVDYQRAKLISSQRFAVELAQGRVEYRDNVTPTVLKKMQRGALESRYTPDNIKGVVRAHLQSTEE